MVRAATPGEVKTYGSEVRRRGFQRHPVVHSCIRVITDIVSSVPLVVHRERGNADSRVPEDHPLQKLLDYPAPRITARQLRARFCVDFLGYGNSLWHSLRLSKFGLPVNLRPINAEAIQNVWVDNEGDAARYQFSDWNGVVQTAEAKDVIHFRDLEMPRPYYPDVFGYPRGAAALESIVTDMEASSYTRQVVKNDGTPTLAVMLEDGRDQEDADVMKARYRERVVKRGMRGDPAFWAGVKDVKSLGFNLTDLEFPDLRRVNREDICSAFGVDPRIIGIGTASSDGGLSGVQYQEARRRLVQMQVEPILVVLCDDLNAWLAPEFGDLWIEPDHDILRDLIEDDEETSVRVDREVKGGLRTWEEGRRALKLPERPAPKETLVVSIGTSLVPVATALSPEPPAVTPTPATPPGSPAAQAAEGEGEGEGASRSMPSEGVSLDKTASPAPPLDPRYVRWRAQNDTLDADEKEYVVAARVRFLEERRRIVRIFELAAEGQVTEPAKKRVAKGADKVPGWADPILEEAVRRALREYAKGGDLWLGWVETFRALVTRTYGAGALDAMSGVKAGGTGLNFQLSSPDVQKAIEDRLETLATLITKDTARQVTAAVRAGEVAGLNIAEIASLIRTSVYGDPMTENRAKTIARTESAGAFSRGAWDQAKRAGIFQSKEWLAFENSKTRTTHSACMAEGRIPIDQPFAANGLLYPLDPAGPADEVINCRCTLVYYDEPIGEPPNADA
ncbi:MAG: phage portal protein [Burkholderiales bacterium]|nr:phage portal protein [Burkholderiales bacterium]